MVSGSLDSSGHVRGIPRRLTKILPRVFVCGLTILLSSCGLGTHSRVITPVYPPLGSWVDPRTSSPPLVDSLTPRLCWKLNPSAREQFNRLAKGNAYSLQYELAIWKARGFSHEETDESGAQVIHSDVVVERPGPLCYRKADLIDTEHIVATPLEPDTVYLWSVRARAVQGGEVYVSEWAVFDSNLNYGVFGLPAQTVVTNALWRFRTPKVEK
jgi:hypothetical protein